MHRPGLRRPSASPDRRARRPGFLLESLESRRMLSATSLDTVTTITPNIASISADVGVGSSVTIPTPVSSALTPAQIAKAYSLSSSATAGSGTTIAIVDAYNDPNIVADLAAFDSMYHLAAANITVENQYGQTTNLPKTDASWSQEIALDVEWAHAAAQGAKIVLVEASSTSVIDLMTAVQTAAKQANVVSMSWGGSEFRGETAYDTAAYFANPNVTFVAASGDDGGASGAEWPAVSPYVVSVGGTTLTLTSAGAISSETAWSASGSRRSGYIGSTGGTSAYEAVPSYQVSALGSGATRRATPDVASDGNPSTGLSVYDSVAGAGQTGWFEVGGTSAGSPLWAGIIAAADQARAATGQGSLSSAQTLSLVYSSSLYASDFHDVTSGSNLVASARKGYDMVTGQGSPVASSLIAAASTSLSAATVTRAVATATTTTVTNATPHVLTAVPVATAEAATASTTTTVVAAPSITPATTIQVTLPPLARSATVSASASAASSSPLSARPTQSLSPSAPVVRLSSSDEELVTTPAPLPPDGSDPFPGTSLAPVVPSLPADPLWDNAIEGLLESLEGLPASGPSSLPVPLDGMNIEIEIEIEIETDETASAAASAAFFGLGFALWSDRRYRSGRADQGRRRLCPVVAR